MKRLSLALVLAFAFAFSALQAQMPTYRLTIENQRVVGSEFQFDIFVQNTSIQDIAFGESDLVVSFNSQYFTKPTLRVLAPANTRFAEKYAFDATFLSANQFGIAVSSPQSFATKEQFLSDVEMIPTNGKKSLVATVLLGGVSDKSGTAGLTWSVKSQTANPASTSKFTTMVSTFTNDQPWRLYFISEGGEFVNPTNFSLSGVSGVNDPVAGESNLSIYPNPVKTAFTVKTPVQSGTVSVKIFSVAGSEIFAAEGMTADGEFKVSLPADIATGSYILKVQDPRNNEIIGTLPLVVVK